MKLSDFSPPDPGDSMLSKALALAANGWHIFPLRANDKTPLLPSAHRRGDPLRKTCHGECGKLGHGFYDATTDPERITEWWTRHLNANIGIACGASGIIVADLDVKHGGTGPANWAEHVADVDHVQGLQALTATGGEHLIWRGSGVGCSVGEVAKDVDIRAEGGYIVAPGSLINGVTYRTSDGRPLPRIEELPLASEALKVTARSRKVTAAQSERETSQGAVAPRGTFLSELLDNPPAEGGRNDWLSRVAGHYASRHRTEPDLYERHLRIANDLMAEPLDEAEFSKTMTSVWGTEQAKPQVLTEDEREKAIEEATERLRIASAARRRYADEQRMDEDNPGRMVDGGEFTLDIPDGTPSVWGEGGQVFWAEGEALMVVGPPGVGKTTLSNQLVRSRIGLGGSVLGLPVAVTKSRVLYLAMDRPRQIARSLRRSFQPSERPTLDAKLVVWQGPPPADLAAHPETLLEMAKQAGADTVIIDSLKDAALGLTEDEVGAGYNRARQLALAAGVEVLEIHHMVKNGANGTKPNNLQSVYGSAWLTAGAGSVILLWGEAGDSTVELVHLKQPAETLGPWKLHHDHQSGVTTVLQGTSTLDMLIGAGDRGLTAAELATFRDDDSRAGKEKARRDLQKLVRQEFATEAVGERSSQSVAIFRATAEARGQVF